MKFWILTALFVGSLCNANATTACKLSKSERKVLLNLPYNEFDQSKGKGWRQYADQGCYTFAAELLNEYQTLHQKNLLDWQSRVMIWHSGQMYAFADDYHSAKERFLKSFNSNEPKDSEILWNDYVYATIAFLDKDLVELKMRRDLIANGPTGSDGKKTNLNIVDSFLKCPNEPYKIAYSGCGK